MPIATMRLDRLRRSSVLLGADGDWIDPAGHICGAGLLGAPGDPRPDLSRNHISAFDGSPAGQAAEGKPKYQFANGTYEGYQGDRYFTFYVPPGWAISFINETWHRRNRTSEKLIDINGPAIVQRPGWTIRTLVASDTRSAEFKRQQQEEQQREDERRKQVERAEQEAIDSDREREAFEQIRADKAAAAAALADIEEQQAAVEASRKAVAEAQAAAAAAAAAGINTSAAAAEQQALAQEQAAIAGRDRELAKVQQQRVQQLQTAQQAEALAASGQVAPSQALKDSRKGLPGFVAPTAIGVGAAVLIGAIVWRASRRRKRRRK